jgi:hypothetical protein
MTRKNQRKKSTAVQQQGKYQKHKDRNKKVSNACSTRPNKSKNAKSLAQMTEEMSRKKIKRRRMR